MSNLLLPRIDNRPGSASVGAPAGHGGGGHGGHGGGGYDGGHRGYGRGYGRGWGGWDSGWGWSWWNASYLLPTTPVSPADYNAGYNVGIAAGNAAITSAQAQLRAGQDVTCVYGDSSLSTKTPSFLQGWAAGARSAGCSVATTSAVPYSTTPAGAPSPVVLCPAAALVRTHGFFANRY